jgi:hypothetical protein
MVTAPTINVRIAITIATMGRLMKNFDMLLTPLRWWSLRLNVALEGFRLDRHSWFEALLAFYDHAFPGL